MQLGDMLVIGQLRPRLLKAFAVISVHLHQSLAAGHGDRMSNITKRSCILSSLATRDFLFRVGFPDVTVRPAVAIMQRDKPDGGIIHALEIGSPTMRFGRDSIDPGPGWTGHMIVALASENYLIDTTLYQARRDAWPELPGMIAIPTLDRQIFGEGGLDVLSATAARTEDGGEFRICWLDQPRNRLWRQARDAIRRQRETAVTLMVNRFGDFHDEEPQRQPPEDAGGPDF